MSGDFVIRQSDDSRAHIPLGRALSTALGADKRTFQRACIAYERQTAKQGKTVSPSLVAHRVPTSKMSKCTYVVRC
eukprot:2348428-Pyramimonas_sp.AAC.1